MRIEGKVAKVLNDRELVLNVGTNDGVEIGMRFAILYDSGLSITDPDDPDKALGSLEWPKTEVKVVNVQPLFSVGRTFRTIKIPAKGGAFGLAINSYKEMYSYEPSRTEIETLRSGSGYAAQELREEDSVVQIGDLAVQVADVSASVLEVSQE